MRIQLRSVLPVLLEFDGTACLTMHVPRGGNEKPLRNSTRASESYPDVYECIVAAFWFEIKNKIAPLSAIKLLSA